MKNNAAFTILVIAIMCTSGLFAVALNAADSSDAATRSNSNWDGEGTLADPYVLYANSGDTINVDFGETTSTTPSSAKLKSDIGLEWEEKEGTSIVIGLVGTLIHKDPIDYEITWTVASESGFEPTTYYLTLKVRILVEESHSGDDLTGYGSEDKPWALHTYEKEKVKLDFISYGTIAEATGLPDDLSVDGTIISGTISDDGKGTYHIVITTSDGEVYYLDVYVGNIVPTYVMYVIIIVLLIIFFALVFRWSSKYNFLSRSSKE